MHFAIQNLSRSLVLWQFSISTAPLRDLSYPLSRSWSFWPYEGWHGFGHISLFSAERKDSHMRGSRLCFWLSLSLWSLLCYVQPILFILYLPAPLLFPLRKCMVWKSIVPLHRWKLLSQENIYFAAVEKNCFPLQLLLLPEQVYLWSGFWGMGKSSKDASCFLLSPLWWLCQLFGLCVTGVFLQILQFLPLFSLYCNDLLVPVFYFWSIDLVYRDYKNMTWAAQSLHLWWMMTWGKAALACHIGVVLTRSLLVWLC